MSKIQMGDDVKSIDHIGDSGEPWYYGTVIGTWTIKNPNTGLLESGWVVKVPYFERLKSVGNTPMGLGNMINVFPGEIIKHSSP